MADEVTEEGQVEGIPAADPWPSADGGAVEESTEEKVE